MLPLTALSPPQVIAFINFVFFRPVLCIYICIENETFVCVVMSNF